MKNQKNFEKQFAGTSLNQAHSSFPALDSRKTLMLINVIMMAGAAAQAHAEDKTSQITGNTNSVAKLPEVVVTGEAEKSSYQSGKISSPKYTEPIRDVPQTITVVPQRLMEDQGVSTLREVLKNVPGISIQAGEGGVPAGDNLSIRGANARTDIFIDGVRDFGGYSRDPFNLEQVEVSKGPSSSAAGRGSTGGYINLSSKVPMMEPLYYGGIKFGTEDYKRITADVNHSLPGGVDGAAFRVNLMYQDGGVSGRNAVHNERWGAAPSMAFGLGSDTRLIFEFFHMTQDNLPDYGIPWVPATNIPLQSYADQSPPAVDFSNFYGSKNRDFEKIQNNLYTARFEHDFNDSIELRDQLRFGETVRDSAITAPRFVSTTSTAINRQLQSRDQTDDVIANQLDLTTRFETFKLDHTLVAGIETSFETSENFARTATALPTADLFLPNPDDGVPTAVVRTGAVTETEASTVAIYAFDTLKISEQWELNGGLRFDNFRVDFGSIAAAGGRTPLFREDNMVSWQVGAVYKPLPNGSIYIGHGTSFNPSAEGLTLSSTATAANNINTDPEENVSLELGTKWDIFDEKLSLSAAIFRNEKTNARTEDPTDPTDIVILDGLQRVDGFEFGISGNITEAWSVFGGYTYLTSEVVESRNANEVGRQLANTPEHSVSLWTVYKFPIKLEAGAGAQYVDSRFNNTGNARQAPDYILYDAMLAYEICKNVTIRFNVYNIFDERYIDRVGGGHFIPGAGRSAVVSTEFKF